MSDRVILAVKFTPAGAAGQVRKAVGGFLRYVQHRDLHPTQPEGQQRPEVSGLLKYVVYRDRASTRAELFGPTGTLNSEDRKAFAAFVANALDRSSPQLFRGRDGSLRDRRRAVYRMIISPEHAHGLDLRALTTAAVGRLERECDTRGVRWIAAIHRNTAHHHVHLVIAGMREDSAVGLVRVDINQRRLVAMKEALALEIQRQRSERERHKHDRPGEILSASVVVKTGLESAPEIRPIAVRAFVAPRAQVPPRRHARRSLHQLGSSWSVLQLRVAAHRYRREIERQADAEARQRGWEHAA